MCVLSHFRHVWLFATHWTVACQAPLSMKFSRKEYWSGLACPPLGDCPYPGIKATSPTLAGRSPGKPISLSRYQQWRPLLFAFRPTSGHSKPQGPGSGLADSPGFLCCFCPCPNTLAFSEIILASTSPHRIDASWRLNPNIIEVISELRKAWVKGFH